ncbi:MAG TPA: hypothetical protein VF305_04035 [Smithellaceae bacterium]
MKIFRQSFLGKSIKSITFPAFSERIMNLVEFLKWIADDIKKFVMENPGNRLERLDGSPIFKEPLIGFAAGSDFLMVLPLPASFQLDLT